jgi:AraC-like DNA-binding protein
VKRQVAPTKDATSSLLVTLLKASLADQGLAVGPTPKRSSSAVAALSQKEAIAETVLAAHGPGCLLAVGDILEKFRGEPVVACLLSAANPIAAIGRWARLQRYVHIKHPAKIVEQSEDTVAFLHEDAGHGPPSPAADLILVSLIAALIARTGGASLNVRIGEGSSSMEIYRNGERTDVRAISPKCNTGIWRFSWINAPRTQTARRQPNPPGAKTSDAALSLIREDLLKVWTLMGLAKALRVSRRTLQRRLLEEGTKLSALVTEARIAHAVRLLENPKNSLGSVGFASGFSDHAHFARSFRRRIGLPPSGFREMLTSSPVSTPPISPSGVRRTVVP